MSVNTVADCLLLALEKIRINTSSNPKLPPPIIGLSGPQGVGKTTALKTLNKKTDLRIATLGIDDFYLTKAERNDLAKNVSPLYRTRGPAGTHDIRLIEKTLNSLMTSTANTRTAFVSFNKVTDERRPKEEWFIFEGRPDVIILEGWLIGAIAPNDFSSSAPLNEIERSDEGSLWRQYQQNQLNGSYSILWQSFSACIHIKGPDFDTIFDWRKEQEANNLQVNEDNISDKKIQWLKVFVQHYQRLTMAMKKGSHCHGATILVDKNRQVIHVDFTNFFI